MYSWYDVDAFEKLRELIDDLFEADDSPDSQDAQSFFSSNSPDASRPCISASFLRKLRARILDAAKPANAKVHIQPIDPQYQY